MKLFFSAFTSQIKAALEGISGIGTITVTDVPYLWLDHYETGCPGRHIFVQFDDLAGDQPLITVESEGLSGDGVSVTVREDVPGGLMSQPIPGHMLQTVEKTPQVRGGKDGKWEEGGGMVMGGGEGDGDGGGMMVESVCKEKEALFMQVSDSVTVSLARFMFV